MALLGLGLKNLAQAWKSSGWTAVPGRWLSADVNQPTAEDPAMTAANIGLAGIYRYEVGGTTRFGNLESFGHYRDAQSSGPGLSDRKLASDQPLIVFYNPEAPDESVLRRGITPRIWLLPGIGLILCVFGGVCMALLMGPAIPNR